MAHSYTSLKQFTQCPRQYHEVRVLRRFPYVQTAAAAFGDRAHAALEAAGRDGTPLPAEFAAYQWVVDELIATFPPGTQYEHEFSFDREGNTVSRTAWNDKLWTGKADVLAIVGENAFVVDWKTGKSSYPDTDQLELMAYFTFMEYPEVQTVRGLLVFLQDGNVHPKKSPAVYRRADITSTHLKFWKIIQEIEQCRAADVWEERQSPLCPWCPVTECPNWSAPKTKVINDYNNRK